MHLLQARTGAVTDGAEAVDLGQTPGNIVYLSAADTELASLANALGNLPDDFPTVRLANLMHLAHPMSVDLYVDQIISEARVMPRMMKRTEETWFGSRTASGICHPSSSTIWSSSSVLSRAFLSPT